MSFYDQFLGCQSPQYMRNESKVYIQNTKISQINNERRRKRFLYKEIITEVRNTTTMRAM